MKTNLVKRIAVSLVLVSAGCQSHPIYRGNIAFEPKAFEYLTRELKEARDEKHITDEVYIKVGKQFDANHDSKVTYQEAREGLHKLAGSLRAIP